ncbi:hypothetical protein D3C78_983270 [compost metagenome]
MAVAQHVDAHQRALDQPAEARFLGDQLGAGIQLALHVEAAADIAMETAVAAHQRLAVQLHPVIVPGARAQTQAQRETIAETAAAGAQARFEQVTIVRVHRLPPALAQAFGPTEAGEVDPGRIHIEATLLRIDPPDRTGDAVEQVFVVIAGADHPLHQRRKLAGELANLVVAQHRQRIDAAAAHMPDVLQQLLDAVGEQALQQPGQQQGQQQQWQ